MTGRVRSVAAAVAVSGLVGCSSGTSPSEPDAAAVLVGSEWTLATINGQPVLSGTRVTAEFSDEQRVSGSAGCNRYFGSAQLEPGKVAIGSLASTRMACAPDAVMTQENQYLQALEAAKSFDVRGDELRLGPSGTLTTLVFRR